MDGTAIALLVAMPLLGLGASVVALRAYWRRNIMGNIPTSKCRGVFIGMTEIKGTAEATAPLTSYLQGARCVSYRYKVEEHWRRTVQETYTDSKGNRQTRTKVETGWTTVDSGGDSTVFFVQDETGIVRIQPEGAQIEDSEIYSQRSIRGDGIYYSKGPAMGIPNSTHERRFTEWAIPLHHTVYVIGQARERNDAVEPEIADDKHQALFLISVRKEEQITRGLTLQQYILGSLGGLLFVLYPLAVDYAQGTQPLYATPSIFVTIGVTYLCVWGIAWSILTLNALVDIKQRAAHASSLIDIQLKRRFDLIGNLVSVVSGLSQHERSLQETVVLLRNELTASTGGQGPDPIALGYHIRMLKEAYPQIVANDAFLQLSTALSDTEQRVALARSYYNDIVQVHNTRIQTIPDSLFARLLGLQARSYFEVNGYERNPVQIKFVQ